MRSIRPEQIETRRADLSDCAAMAEAHRDSIWSIGVRFYSLQVVEAWQEGVVEELYQKAMQAGEVFFIAIAHLDAGPMVLGFASDYSIEGPKHGISVYVRGSAARCGIGSALLRLAEQHAASAGATGIEIEASLAAVDFYKALGYVESHRGETHLSSGHPIACAFMRKPLVRCVMGRDDR